MNFFFSTNGTSIIGVSGNIFFTNNTLISLLFAHSLCASGVRVNIDLTRLLGFQQLNTFNGNSD